MSEGDEEAPEELKAGAEQESPTQQSSVDPPQGTTRNRFSFLGTGEKTLHRAAAVTASVVAIAGAFAWVRSQVFDTVEAQVSNNAVEVIVDSSAGMGAPFGDGSKLSVAQKHVKNLVANRGHDSYALRHYGPSCNDATELREGLAQGNHEQVASKVLDISPRGPANLVGALRSAASDFSDPRTRVAVTRSIVAVVGSGDECTGRTADLGQVADELARSEIQVDWHFVALSVPPDERDHLEDLAADTKGETRFVDSEGELAETLEFLLNVKPSLAELESLDSYVGSTVDDINKVGGFLNSDDKDAAEAALRAARAKFADSEEQYSYLGPISEQERYKKLYRLIQTQRKRQSDVMAKQAEAIQVKGKARDALVDELNEVVAAYNEDVESVSQLAEEIAEELIPE